MTVGTTALPTTPLYHHYTYTTTHYHIQPASCRMGDPAGKFGDDYQKAFDVKAYLKERRGPSSLKENPIVRHAVDTLHEVFDKGKYPQ